MADLFSVYGMTEEPAYPSQGPQATPSFPPAPEMTQQGKPVKQMVSVQQPNEVVYQPPPAMYAQEQGPMVSTPPPPTDSFWDRMSQKRFEVLKVVVLAMIVLLAISTDHVVSHYLTQYLSNSILTSVQEFLVRFSYPIAVLLMIWFIKSM